MVLCKRKGGRDKRKEKVDKRKGGRDMKKYPLGS